MSIVKTTLNLAISTLIISSFGTSAIADDTEMGYEPTGHYNTVPEANPAPTPAANVPEANPAPAANNNAYAPTGHYTAAPTAVVTGDLFDASKTGDFNTVRGLLDQGANPNLANGDGETPLHAAASTNQQQVALLLIQKGANVNATTVGGWTPLHTSARFGAFQVTSLLLNNGANPHAVNADGNTPEALARVVNDVRMASLIRYHTK